MKRQWITIAVVGALAIAAALLLTNPGTNGVDPQPDGVSTSGVIAPPATDPPGSVGTNAPLPADSVSKQPEQNAVNTNPSDAARFVEIAYRRAGEAMEIPDPGSATVDYDGDHVIVTFPPAANPDPDRPPLPGPDYLARVRIDRASGEVVELLVAP